MGHSLKKLQVVIDSIQGVDSALHLSSLYSDFSKADAPEPGRNPEKQDEPPASLSNSPSSSCGHSSSSSQSFSHRTRALIKQEEPGGSPEENQREMLKRAHSEAQLRLPPAAENPGLLIKSQSFQSLGETKPAQCSRASAGPLRVKASHGKEKIRLRLQPAWRLKDLKQEIARRFGIVRSSSMELKYLDDDSEWVLMTCDADLQECGDIHRSSGIPTVKISVQHPARPRAAAAAASPTSGS